MRKRKAEAASAEEEVSRKEGHSRARKESGESCGLRSSRCPACGGLGPSLPPLPSIARFGASVGADGCGGWAGRRRHRHRRAAGHAGGAGRGGQGVCGRRRRASSGSCRAGAEYRRKGMPSYASREDGRRSGGRLQESRHAEKGDSCLSREGRQLFVSGFSTSVRSMSDGC